MVNKLEQMIQEFCPNGVERVALCEVAKVSNGRDHKALSDGKIPVYGSGGVMRYANQCIYDKPSVLIPRKGSLGNIFFVNEPFWTVDTIFYTVINERKIEPKYFYYSISARHIEDLNQAGGVPSMTKAVLDKIRIPLPPLPIQSEIVRILDNFTELTAELTARKKQYEHYRNELLTFGDDVPMVPLGTVAKNLDSKRKPVTKGNREAGVYPYYGASGIVDYVSDYIFDGDYLLVSEDGANLVARVTPIAFSASGKIWVNNHAHVLQFETYAERKFIEYYLNMIDIGRFISAAAQPKLTQDNLNKIPVPAPTIEEQERIVAILDKFDALTTDISSGLPAEIAARNTQYEYYRDKLLSFKEASA
jgi:type I restriction enzyme S subunit